MRTSAFITLLNGMGQVVSFVVLAVIAALFGATEETDAFFLALTVPALFIGPVVNSIHSVFVPVITGSSIQQPSGTGQLVGSGIVHTGLLSLLATGLFAATTPTLVDILAGGLSAAQRGIVVRNTYFLLPLIVLQCLSGFLAAALNAGGKFLLPAVAFTLRHLAGLAVLVAVARPLGADSLPVAFVMGAVVQLLILVGGLGGLRFRPELVLRVEPELRRALKMSVPLLASSVVLQGGMFVSRLFAARLPAGSVTIFDYASRITTATVELLMSGVLLVSAVNWSELVARGNYSEVTSGLRHSILGVLFLLVPFAAILFVLRVPVIELFLGRGELDPAARLLTAVTLGFLVLGIPPEVVARLYLRVFLARQHTAFLAAVACVRLGSLVLIALVVLQPFGLRGLALAESLSIALYLASLVWGARRILGTKLGNLTGSVLRLLVASGFSGLIAILGRDALSALPPLLVVPLIGTLAVATYVLVCAMLHVPEVTELWRSVRR